MGLPKNESIRNVLRILSERKGKKVSIRESEPVSEATAAPAVAKRTVKPGKQVAQFTLGQGQHNDPRAVCHSVYNFLQHSGLIVAPERDINLGKQKSYKMNDSGSEKMSYSSIRYSSYLLFPLLTSLMDRGSMIFFGPPGTGKTTAPELISKFLYGIPINKIQEGAIYGNPELTLSDMVATVNIGTLLKTGKEVVKPRGFMHSMIRIIDEVNRITPGKLSILYQVADRGWTEYKNVKIMAPPGPLFATANAADSGNYEMPLPFLDRFDVAVNSNYVNANYLEEVCEAKTDKMHSNLENMVKKPHPLTGQDLVAIRQQMRCISFEPEALNELVFFIASLNSCFKASRDESKKTKAHAQNKQPGALCTNCHYQSDKNICSYTKNGLSTRTYWSTYTYAKAFAWWMGSSKVEQDDLEVIIPFLLYHKVQPTNIALDKDEFYVNDRIALVKDMYEMSCNQYDIVRQQFPFDAVTNMIRDAYQLGKVPKVSANDIEKLFNDLKNIDSPVKYAMGAAILDIKEKMEMMKNGTYDFSADLGQCG